MARHAPGQRPGNERPARRRSRHRGDGAERQPAAVVSSTTVATPIQIANQSAVVGWSMPRREQRVRTGDEAASPQERRQREGAEPEGELTRMEISLECVRARP